MNKYACTLLAVTMVFSLSSFAAEEEDPVTPRFTPPSFNEVDTDGNEMISIGELNVYRETMQQQMGNENGRQMNRKDSVSAFASFDKNKDGVITEDEFAAHARYSNPGNGTGELKTFKNTNTNRQMNTNAQKNQNENRGKGGGGSGGNSNGKGKNQ